MRKTPEQRFLAKVVQTTDCWQWTGAIDPSGYGRFCDAVGRMDYAHRWSYAHYVGPIPAGFDIDHTCHDGACLLTKRQCPHRSCVNPAHLAPATRRANLLRGNTVTAARAAQTHCLRGHPLSGPNLWTYRGTRHCRACWSVRKARQAKAAS